MVVKLLFHVAGEKPLNPVALLGPGCSPSAPSRVDDRPPDPPFEGAFASKLRLVRIRRENAS
jgi:hypothetical protein